MWPGKANTTHGTVPHGHVDYRSAFRRERETTPRIRSCFAVWMICHTKRTHTQALLYHSRDIIPSRCSLDTARVIKPVACGALRHCATTRLRTAFPT